MSDRAPSPAGGDAPPHSTCVCGHHLVFHHIGRRGDESPHVECEECACSEYREARIWSGDAPAAAGASPDRERLGVMLRELEVIVGNYHSDGWRTRNESDAELFAEWQRIRGALFDALSDLTRRLAGAEARADRARRDFDALWMERTNLRSAVFAAAHVIGQCDCIMSETSERDPKKAWREARDRALLAGAPPSSGEGA